MTSTWFPLSVPLRVFVVFVGVLLSGPDAMRRITSTPPATIHQPQPSPLGLYSSFMSTIPAARLPP